MAFNETAATEFPSYSRVHVAVQFHTHQCGKRLVPGRLDGPLHVGIIYPSLSHSVSWEKFPRVKLDIAACEKKFKKICKGRAFHFNTGGTQSRWKKSSRHTVGVTEAYTSLYFSPARRKAETEFTFKGLQVWEVLRRVIVPSRWGNAQLSRGWKCPEQKLILLIVKTALKRYYVAFYYLRITAPESFW